MTFDVLEEVGTPGLDKLFKGERKPPLVVKFEVVLTENVNFVTLLLHLGKVRADILACFSKCDFFELSLFCSVVDDKLMIYHRNFHLEEGYAACD